MLKPWVGSVAPIDRRAIHAQNQLFPRHHHQHVWDEGHHGRPHFHAYYGEHEASVDLTGEIIAGGLPRRQLRLVQAWTELHADDLAADWELAVNRKPLKPIPPLR